MPKPKKSPVNETRAEAWRLVDGVVIGGKVISDLVGMDQHHKLDAPQRAASMRIALQTLRFADRADWVMKPFLNHAPHPTIRNLLRLGIVEVCAESAASHGVVNDLVSLAGRSNRTAGLKGLVNAVMRKSLEKVEGNWDKAPVPKLPKWLRKPLAVAYGNAALQGIEVAHMKSPPLDLTVKSDPSHWAEKLNGTLLPNGTVRLASGQQVSALNGFDAGEWWVQDAAAAMPVQISGVQKGEKVLDLCAAPGGKTLQMANLGAEVTAVDISEQRLVRLQENLTRTKLSADIKVEDAMKLPKDQFDVVLLDAPCSATGTIRRHPDLCHARDGAEINGLIQLQAKLLRHAAKLVSPGGTLIFCTCSLIPDEGEVQVEEFLSANKGFQAKKITQPWIEESWRTEEGGVRLRPDYWSELGGMDGFYIACLQHKN